jgi:hypothetical protein
MKFQLSAKTRKQIEDLQSEISDELDVLRTVYDTKSERWQESDSGVAVDGWLDTLDQLVDDLSNVETEPS